MGKPMLFCWENAGKTQKKMFIWIETGKLSSMDGDLPVRAHRNLKHVQMPQAFLQNEKTAPLFGHVPSLTTFLDVLKSH